MDIQCKELPFYVTNALGNYLSDQRTKLRGHKLRIQRPTMFTLLINLHHVPD